SLLTGRSPHARDNDTTSMDEAICTLDPAPLSSQLPRDLNLVVRKALKKDPLERYATVDAFGDDLKAVLESRPVAARRADAWYRTVKFVRRHWLPLAAAVAVILSLTIGLYVSRREQALAQRRFSQLRNFSNRVLTLDEEIQGLPGSTKVREK